MRRVGSRKRGKCQQRAVLILLVPPSPDHQRRHGRVREGDGQRAARPRRVVRRMRHEALPGRPLIRSHGRGQRPQCGEGSVPVVGVVAFGLGRDAVARRRLELPAVLQPVAQPERALMEEVVAHPGVAHGRLRADRLERRMGPDPRHGRQPTGIRDPQNADAAIVVRYVVHQPLDGVIGVGALIRTRRRAPRQAVHLEGALRGEPTTNVLEHEDVAIANEIRERHRELRRAAPVGGAVRRPGHEDRQRTFVVLGSEDDGEQPHPIAHRDRHLGSREGAVDGRRLGPGP